MNSTHEVCVCVCTSLSFMGFFSLGATAAALLSSTQNAFSLGKYKRTKIRVEKKIYSLNWIVGIVQSSYFVILLYTNVLSSNYWRSNCSLMTGVHFFSTKILAEESIGIITNYDAAFSIYLGYKN